MLATRTPWAPIVALVVALLFAGALVLGGLSGVILG
jgi:hypothetical protein